MAVMPVSDGERAQPTLVIERKGAGLAATWTDLWAFRHLVRYLAARELKGRYRALSLGRAWFFIRPLSEMLIYVLIFGVVLKIHRGDLPYPLHVYTGLVAWLFFANVTNRVSTSFNAYRGMMTKVYFPRLVPPLVAAMIEGADFLASCLFIVVLLVAYRWLPGLSILSLPFWLLVLALWSVSFGLAAAALSVRYRDVTMLLAIFLRCWIYMTPVVYPVAYVPEAWRWLYFANPMAVIVEGFRAAITGGTAPPAYAIAWTVLATGLLAVLALRLYRRTERDIVDHF